ncbi:DUF47 domain-containing protein [Desulfovibrio inopinatus]|uniref:DUF47 domain-containing protein n=1 Tax=Desulfovibrio inopinatus TaxID=102109 RepID=UPI0004149C00|nr:DUF47 family protein [Desulfovibrio inopinatus]
MSLRIPFFGLLSKQSPMLGLLDHFDQINEGARLVEEALECYIVQGPECGDLQAMFGRIDKLEEKADKVKRSIRNHLPRGLFMPVDKTLFFNYTSRQDNILDEGQLAMHWLMMRPVVIPETLQKPIIDLIDDVVSTITLLRTSLINTTDLVLGKSYDRVGTKESYRTVRKQHRSVWKQHNTLLAELLNRDCDFKDSYQLINFIEKIYAMSHNAEGCADILRAMISR